MKAALLIIGNEILSGRTHDKNLPWLAEQLNEIGVRLAEARVVMDIEEDIIKAVTELSEKYDYVMTTGGIGPTHDDITAECIAKAFGTELELNPQAHELLKGHYKPEDLNEARLKMAHIPIGAQLLDNPVSSAPGFKIKNVFVMAGVPRIMQAMFDSYKSELKGGAKMLAKDFVILKTEGDLAGLVSKLQDDYPETEVGSYPFVRDGQLGTSIVIRSLDADILQKAADEFENSISAMA